MTERLATEQLGDAGRAAGLTAALGGRYVVEREIGRGGMATVYLARDVRHKRPVALKVLDPELSQSLGVERFLREIELAARLTHPHILPVHDSGEAAGTVYYVMPFVEGESLRHRMDRDGPLDVDVALGIVGAIADALTYAHEQGVVHRDVKPENVLLFQGHATLADFGIARAIASSGGEHLTQTGLIVGTPAYMSPEQAAGDGEIDGASDIYSLACVLYEMLTGEPPFASASVAATIARRITSGPPSVRERRADVGELLASELQRAMATDAAERHQNASAFAEALRAARSASVSSRRKAIAVLPFANLSSDPENEYFSDGLTEELIADLSKVKSLQVTSRTSVMRMKNTTDDLRTIGRKLGVRYVLEGSVRKAASTVRITAQLIDAQTDTHLWSDKFGGAAHDVFDLQERVSREIVRALDLTLSSAEERRLASRRVEDLRVLDCYLRARHEIYRLSADSIDRATRLLVEGLAIAPGNALLETALGIAEVSRAKTSMGYDEKELAHAEARARRVIASDPELPQGEFLLGFIAFERGALIEAVRHFRRALDIDPSYADAAQYMSLTHFYAGSIAPAREHAQRLVAVDPLSASAWIFRAVAEWPLGRFEEAAVFSTRALDIDPDGFFQHWIHGYTLALGGRYDEAQSHCDVLMAQSADSPYTAQLSGLLHGAAGRRREALEVLATLDRVHLDHHETFHAAESYAAAGELDRAVAMVDSGIAKGFYPAHFIAETNPFMKPLRALPGFARVVQRARVRAEEFERWRGE
jgi:eukaryotic-like serine/threonine-protein kinase